MASLDYRLNPLFTIKECSSCGSLYNKGYCCTPDSSQQPLRDCPKCGNPVEGPNYQGCALWRKKLKEVWFTICHENGIYQDLLNTCESYDDDTNVVNAPREPFIVKQDPGVNSSQSPSLIDHHCCYECRDSLDDIFCQRCTCESCGKGAHYGYNCPPKVPIISNPEPCYHQNVDEFPQTLPSFHPTSYSGDENSFTYDSNLNFVDDSPNPPPQPPTYSYEFCGNDAHYGYDCPPQVPFIYNPEPCYNQDFNFLQNFQSFQQQYPCCENCGGPHETFQCHPMNENYYEPNFCYDSNSFSFDQVQPPQYLVIHHPPQETTVEMLQARENLMESIETFLKKFNRIYFMDTPKVLMQAWDNFFEIKHACKEKQHQPEIIQELLHKLLNDVQIISEEQAKYINSPSWNRPAIYYDDDDDEESSIPLKDIIISGLPPCVAITSTFDALSDHSEIFIFVSNDDDVILREKLLNINRLIANIESLKDNPSSDRMLKSPSSVPIPITDNNSFFEKFNTSFSFSDNYLPEFETFSDHTEETRSGTLISIVISDNSNNPLLELPEFESFHFDLYDDPSFPRPPPEPPNVEICLNFKLDAPVINNFDELNEDECFNPGGGEIDFSQNVEDDDSFTFVIRTFLPFLTYPADSALLLSTKNEDTIFDSGIST
ncbi:hypothetical protein Tco_1439943 [Tanacetum coccineum]